MPFILVVLTLIGTAFAGRPDQAFSFKENSCVCRDDKPVSKGDCVDVCRGKITKGIDVLFAEFSVSSVLANSSLKHVKNWCFKYLVGDSAFPKCALEAVNANGNKTLFDIAFTKNNSITANVSSLADDDEYTFRMIETTSKTASLPHGVYIFDPIGIPLKTRELSQYSCIPKTEKSQRTHFYFSMPWVPTALTGTESLVCHDVVKFGETDSQEFPRLDLNNSSGLLWNQSNFLFFDNDGDGVLDINELVIKKVKENSGTIKSSVRLFGLLSSPGSRELNREAGNGNFDHLGFVMSYFVDGTTFRSSCPSEADYASGTPLMKVMKEIFSRGTEGIYVADRSENEVRDSLLIRESDLRPVWFYLNSGVPTAPNEENVTFQPVFFHYPVNKANPYVKGPNQKTYRVRTVQEVGNLTTLQAFLTSTGEMISYPSHDRKIACVPKL